MSTEANAVGQAMVGGGCCWGGGQGVVRQGCSWGCGQAMVKHGCDRGGGQARVRHVCYWGGVGHCKGRLLLGWGTGHGLADLRDLLDLPDLLDKRLLPLLGRYWDGGQAMVKHGRYWGG